MRLRFVIVALLVLVPVIRIAMTYPVFSQVLDEPYHVATGFQWLSEGRYDLEPQHPPLARVLFALPSFLRGASVSGDVVARGNQLLAGHVTAARLPNLLFFLLALITVGLWTRELYGDRAAVIAMALFGALPPVLAHAGLATTDMAAAATLVFALYALHRANWWLLGVAIGLGLIAKFSFVLFFPVAALCLRRRVPLRSLAIAAMIVFAAYRFDIGTLAAARLRVLSPDLPENTAAKYAAASGYEWVRADHIRRYQRFGELAEQRGVRNIDFVDWAKAAGHPSPLAGRRGNTMAGAPPVPPPSLADRALEPLRRAGHWIVMRAPIPAPLFWVGIDAVRIHDQIGHPAFLLGEIRDHGWWYYFPVVLFFKTPIAFLLLAAFAMRNRLAFAALAILLVAMTSSINIGVRHILPLYPLLAICAGYAATRLPRWAAAALLAWFFIATTLAHPDYLAYFNEAAGRHPENIALDSNLDWGQDLNRLARDHPSPLHIAYFGTASIDGTGEPLPPATPVAGWVAISEMKLRFEDYRWLDAYRPVRRVGKSIRLYHVENPPARPPV
ncbi:MAG TPA: glycosyltransferase family 39 protein [Thermoanaerobaculia bacterium]|nr:glycosyltransferase family 39 protein [Thermoanaerobaculia bacterium]